jgi:hypothetical protein
MDGAEFQRSHPTTRREVLRGAVGAVAAVTGAGLAGCGVLAAGETPATRPVDGQRAVRDRLWVWTHPAGVYGRDFGLTRLSRMTPVEGAVYLGVPNLLFIRYKDRPSMPFDPYAIAFRSMKRVVWSLVGASGRSDEAEREHVLDLARRYSNITGFVMDDYFHADGTGSLSVEQLEALRGRLVIDGRRRDLHVVVYDRQLGLPIGEHLALCDKITYWTWKAANLDKLESSFGRLEELAPAHGKLLGCYLWDFGGSRPMPLELMKKQVDLGRRWLEQGRIEGMIFLASNVCDLELEAVEWTRGWIAECQEG